MSGNLFSKHPPQDPSKNGSGNAEPVVHGNREGFCILQSQFELPTDSVSLDRQSKRALTICNLFVNHQLPVSQIAHLLEEDLGQVVQILVQKKIVRDRRGSSSLWPSDIERRKARRRT